MNEDYFDFYIDSLEVFAIQKWENLKKKNQKKTQINKNKLKFEFNFIIKKIKIKLCKNIINIYNIYFFFEKEKKRKKVICTFIKKLFKKKKINLKKKVFNYH